MRQRGRASALARGIGMVAVLGYSGPTYAACTSYAPASGETVTCHGGDSTVAVGSASGVTVNVESGVLAPSSSVPAISGHDATNFTLNVRSGATVTSADVIGTIDVYVDGASSGTVIVDGLIENTGLGTSLYLKGPAGWSVSIGETGQVMNNSSVEAAIETGGGADSITIAGTVSNSGSGGAIYFSGNNDRLELWSTYSITGVVNGASGTDTLALGGSGDGTFDVSSINYTSGQFRYFELFEKIGSSTWTLTGTSTATDDWTVKEGTLDIDPAADLSTMGVIVENGGTLTGRGRMGSLTIESGGVIAPTGHVTENMQVTDLIFNPGSTFVVTTGASSDYSRISATTATINGGWVEHTGSAQVGSTYIIAASSLTGAFDGVSTSFAFLDAALR